MNKLGIFNLAVSSWMWIIFSYIYFYIWIDGGKLNVVEHPIVAFIEMGLSVLMVFLCVVAIYQEVRI